MTEAIEVRKQNLGRLIEDMKGELCEMSDFLFSHPEIGFQEVQASALMVDFLCDHGFSVERGYAGLPTAFRAISENGNGGPHIGLLCEYDALPNMGHACAHHLQGPSVIGAALAIKLELRDLPFVLEVIGTPAEETERGGKNVMLENGAFKHLDVALMMHGSDTTSTDMSSMALSEFVATYTGLASHAAIAPEKGRSALDAAVLALNGIGLLRGHVRDDTRLNAILENGGQAVNAVPEKAVLRIEARSADRPSLDEVVARLARILDGAAMMTETSCKIRRIVDLHNKIPVPSLNRLLMENAEAAHAKRISPPREKTGSTDFASVMYFVPGSCIRTAFVELGTPSHSQAYLDHGISDEAHEAVVVAAKILAMTAFDLIREEKALAGIREEFRRTQDGHKQSRKLLDKS